MYVRESSSKRKGKVSRTFQIVESYRDERGKVKQRTLLHLGPADKFLEKDVDNLINGLLKVKGLTLESLDSDIDEIKHFGQIYALIHLWKELKISQSIAKARSSNKIQFDLEKHIKSLVFNRLDDPSSKLKLLTWLETVHIPGINREEIRYEYLLRAMDFLIEHKRDIEGYISRRFLTMFDQELKLCFYDLTSTYFEADSSLTEDDIRQKGYSRDHRADLEQIVIGVVMTQDGIPLAHYTFPGNTSDKSTLTQVVEDIKSRFGVSTVILVADKGMVNGNNLRFLIENGDDFILGESVRQSKSARQVIEKAEQSRINSHKEGEYIFEIYEEKQTTVFDPKTDEPGIKKRSPYRVKLRYIAGYNPEIRMKKYQTRLIRVTEALEEIEDIKKKQIPAEDRYSQIKALLSRKRLSRFFNVALTDNKIVIHKADEEFSYEEKCDGWFIVITQSKILSKEEIITRYKELKYVEHGFFELKHSLQLRPNFHWTENRIKAHVMVCFMAFQMAVLFEKRLESIKLSWEKALDKLRRIQVVEWENEGRLRRGMVKVKTDQIEIFKSLGIPKPTVASL